MTAWQEIQKGQPNPLVELVKKDARITKWIAPDTLKKLFDVEGYTGMAATRSRELARQIREQVR